MLSTGLPELRSVAIMLASMPSRTELNVRKGKHGRFPWILSIANLLFLVALCIVEAVIAERHWLAMLVTYAPQQVFLAPLAALLVASLLARDRRALALNALAGVLSLTLLLGFRVPLRMASRASGPTVRVMTCNIHHGSHGAVRIAEAIRRLEPDVVCLQEANALKPWKDPKPELLRSLRGWHSTTVSDRQVVLSRHPITSQRAHWFPCTNLREVTHAVISVDGLRLNVLNAHFITSESGRSLSQSRGAVRAYVKEAASARSRQYAGLTAIAGGLEGPLVIAGDFNTPPRGRLYRRFCRRFTDSFRAAGFGFGYTFRSDVPVERIDHIFVGEGLSVISCRASRVSMSDHRPVVADLAVIRPRETGAHRSGRQQR